MTKPTISDSMRSALVLLDEQIQAAEEYLAKHVGGHNVSVEVVEGKRWLEVTGGKITVVEMDEAWERKAWTDYMVSERVEMAAYIGDLVQAANGEQDKLAAKAVAASKTISKALGVARAQS